MWPIRPFKYIREDSHLRQLLGDKKACWPFEYIREDSHLRQLICDKKAGGVLFGVVVGNESAQVLLEVEAETQPRQNGATLQELFRDYADRGVNGFNISCGLSSVGGHSSLLPPIHCSFAVTRVARFNPQSASHLLFREALFVRKRYSLQRSRSNLTGTLPQLVDHWKKKLDTLSFISFTSLDSGAGN
ncbi:hypothetical protein R1flu_012328 [Riccia fluitans]|uniref:Uncharacterized protein n=1 Tax=Riccia fluitans TaxID=41844 RepID=A0ABD1ZAE3_9MARC